MMHWWRKKGIKLSYTTLISGINPTNSLRKCWPWDLHLFLPGSEVMVFWKLILSWVQIRTYTGEIPWGRYIRFQIVLGCA